jgi:hypothetical protein
MRSILKGQYILVDLSNLKSKMKVVIIPEITIRLETKGRGYLTMSRKLESA